MRPGKKSAILLVLSHYAQCWIAQGPGLLWERACSRCRPLGLSDRPSGCYREQARSHSKGGGLQMQRMPQRAQRRFLHGFTQGRVGVDGAGDVFQAGAHFQ